MSRTSQPFTKESERETAQCPPPKHRGAPPSSAKWRGEAAAESSAPRDPPTAPAASGERAPSIPEQPVRPHARIPAPAWSRYSLQDFAVPSRAVLCKSGAGWIAKQKQEEKKKERETETCSGGQGSREEGTASTHAKPPPSRARAHLEPAPTRECRCHARFSPFTLAREPSEPAPASASPS